MKIKPISKRLFLLAIFCLLRLTGIAQGQQDILYLKNGSVIKGTIIEMIPGKTIKIETTDGNVFSYKLEEVEKTEKEVSVKKIPQTKDTTPQQKFAPTGYFLMVRIGPNITPYNVGNNLNFCVSFINGVQINEQFSVGVGIEATDYSYNDEKSDAVIIPIFFDARLYVPLKRVHPMISFQGGYSTVNASTELVNSSRFNPGLSKGGLFMSLGIGVRMFVTKKISILADGGSSFQNLKGYTTAYDGSTIAFPNRDILSFRLTAGIALSFGKN